MISGISERLERLMQALGLSTADGSCAKAEIKAYTAALTLAFSKMEELFKNLFIDTAESSGLALLLSMVGASFEDDAELCRQKITERISQNTGTFSESDFQALLEEILGGLLPPSYTIDGNVIKVEYVGVLDENYMRSVSEIYNNHIPCFSIFDMGSTGLPFLCYDSLIMRWFELDALNLPFNVLESL